MILKINSKGKEVKQLQEFLGVSADGSFGKGTEAAVKAWQSNNSLIADGIVGDSTWSKMVLSTTILPLVNMPKSNFKLENLKGYIPYSVISQIPETATTYNITTVLRLAHFLSQCGHESGNFKAVTENLNYGASGLSSIFKKYFPTNAKALLYERNPEKIANLVYSSRMGNGNEDSGDGWKHRGRGYIQLTGKDNYAEFNKTVNDDIMSNPDLVSTKYPLSSAAFFFNRNSLWSICDKGSDVATITAVTKRVNGGTNGLDDRIKHFNKFYNLLK